MRHATSQISSTLPSLEREGSPDSFVPPAARAEVVQLAAVAGAPAAFPLQSWSYRVGKRFFDLLLATFLLPVLLPVFVLLTLLVKCSSKGSAFYKHLRVGQGGREFYLYKFRTMFPHDETLLSDYLATNVAAQREWEEQYKLRWDPRVTPLGAILPAHKPG